MGVTTQQLLQPDMGVRLPVEVRRSLVAMGTACNQAAVHLQYASTHSLHIEAIAEAHRVSEQASTPATQAATDLQRLADQHFEQAIVVLARAATVYAVYSTQVALAVAASREPPPPGAAVILPSDVIAAAGHYLPEVCFSDDGNDRVAAEQNETVGHARRTLIELVTYRMQGESALAYDDIATVTADGGINRQSEFADALHVYAGVLVWSVAVFSGVSPDHGPRR
ncbi:hypothetical protein GCM10020358_49470 [Amorphoplanes nipponensis]|uniref:Uncharacterized protein n=1 Tax=Actinoplanes nipponensis TaxID=135950 RepID=A0A919JLR5_9ACTN|nr:hypothetical protein [Actinoplanes nipponensis]GIE53128.1 hypothetical protein Ani05nite_66620 [Actinoplanes nipponensis]